MTVPGDLDKIPIKVVPIYLEPVEEYTPLEPEVVVEEEPTDPPRRSLVVVGLGALLAAVATAILTGIGVSVASAGGYDAGTIIAWAAVVLSVVAVLAGLTAIIAGWGRWLGVAAVILGVAANPWLLATVLGFLAAP